MEPSSGWEWWAFWMQLAATLVGFLLGIPYGLFLLWLQRQHESHDKESDYAGLAFAVERELDRMCAALKAWKDGLGSGQRLPSADVGPLVWDALGVSMVHFIRKETFASTQQAISFYRRALELGKKWNLELSSTGKLGEGTKGATILQVEASLANIEAAIAALVSSRRD